MAFLQKWFGKTLAKSNPKPSAGYFSFDGATPTRRRTFWWTELLDSKDEYDKASRDKIISDARKFYNWLGFAKAAVNGLADQSVGSGFTPQFRTADAGWNDKASQYVQRWFSKSDVRGLHSFATQLKSLSRAIDIDGEAFIVFVKGGADGNWPLLQYVAAHRCKDNPDFKGNGKQIQGIVFNDSMRPLAYSFETESGFITVDAVNVYHLFNPVKFDEIHGQSSFAGCIANCLDLFETLDNEKVAQKEHSSVFATRKTITGAAATDSPYPDQSPQPSDIAAGNLPTVQTLAGRTIYQLPAESIEVLGDRSDSWLKLTDYLVRDICLSMGVPYESIVNPEKLSGTALYQVQARMNRAVESRQQILIPFATKVVGWVIGGAIKRGELPPQPEWWRFTWQMPRKDNVNDSRAARQKLDAYKLGVTVLDDLAAEDGRDWIELRQQRQHEVDDLLTRAKELSAKHGIQLATAIELLEMRTPNANEAAAEIKEAA